MKKILTKINNILHNTMVEDTILSLVSKGIGMLFFLATDIAIARLLSKNEYGEWSFYYSIVSMCFWIVWLGINESVKVFVAKEREYAIYQNSNIHAGFKLRAAVSLIFLLVLLVIGSFAADHLGYPQKYPHLKALFLSGSFLCFFNSFSEFYKGVNIGLVKFKNIFILTLAEFGGNLVFGLGCLVLSKSILGLGWGYAIAAAMTSFTGSVLLRRHLKEGKGERADERYEKDVTWRILKYAMPILFVSIGALILTEMDVFMLGVMSNPEETGTYSIAKSLTGKVTHVNLAICTSTMTTFAVITSENLDKMKALFKKIMLQNTALVLVVSLLLGFLGPYIIRILYGEKYTEVGDILICLIPYYAIYAITIFMSALLDYQEKAKQRVPIYFGMVFLNLVFNYLWIPKYGALGAAIATDLSMIPYLVGLAFLTKRVFSKKQSRNK